MQLLITNRNAVRHEALLDKVYRFRHDFFVNHMKWEALRKPDGREIDEFDTPSCAHIVGIDGAKVISYTRLLPTTEPHLLTHVYPEILDGAPSPAGPTIWEWTRCAVAPASREGRRGADPATIGMFLGVTEACLFLGVSALLVETHPLLLTRCIELGWKCRPLALPKELDGSTVVPFKAELKDTTLATSRALFGVNESVLTIEDELRDQPSLPALARAS